MCLFSPEKLSKNYCDSLNPYMTTEAHPWSLQVPMIYICTIRWISRESRDSYKERQCHYTAVLLQDFTVYVSPSAANINTGFRHPHLLTPRGVPVCPHSPAQPRGRSLLPTSDAGLGARKHISSLSPMLWCAVPSLHRLNPFPASPRRKWAPSRSSSTAALRA